MIPIITEGTVTVSESFTKYLINIPGKHIIKEVQKAVVLGTEHILQKVLILCVSILQPQNSCNIIYSRDNVFFQLYNCEIPNNEVPPFGIEALLLYSILSYLSLFSFVL